MSDSYAGNHIRKAAATVNEDYEAGREKSLVLTKLEEADMWLRKCKEKPKTE